MTPEMPSISVHCLFAAAMDAGDQQTAAWAILAHPGSAHFQQPGKDMLVDVAIHGVEIEPRKLDVLMALADCWEALA